MTKLCGLEFSTSGQNFFLQFKMEHTQMLTKQVGRFSCAVLAMSAPFFLVGCSKPDVACGVAVSPQHPTAVELQLLEVVRVKSVDFCSQVQSASCDLSVYQTKAGWTVKATPSFPYQGRCVTRMGG